MKFLRSLPFSPYDIRFSNTIFSIMPHLIKKDLVFRYAIYNFYEGVSNRKYVLDTWIDLNDLKIECNHKEPLVVASLVRAIKEEWEEDGT